MPDLKFLTFRSLIALFCIVVSLAAPEMAWAQNEPTHRVYTETGLKAVLHDLTPISLRPGMNNVYFKGIDESGRITVAYMQSSSTGGHNMFIVTTGDPDDVDGGNADPTENWLLVPIGTNKDETIDDAPQDGELTGKSVRFFNATIGNTPETLLISSNIDGDTMVAPAHASISVQELEQVRDEPPFWFIPILEFKTMATYYNADSALLKELNIPLPN
jgi:hypothetical protein